MYVIQNTLENIDIAVQKITELATTSVDFLYMFANIKAFTPGGIAAVITALLSSSSVISKIFFQNKLLVKVV